LRHVVAAFAKTNGLVSEASFNTRLDVRHALVQRGCAGRDAEHPAGRGSPDYAVSSVSVSNSILGAYGTRVPAYENHRQPAANYNNRFLANGALAALSHTGRSASNTIRWAPGPAAASARTARDPVA
jgi:hypothetical protein